jgi:general secretion pathway protein E
LETGELDVRVSFLPTPMGENVAIRLLYASQLLPLGQLGLGEDQRQPLETILGKSSGLVLITGPSKSGISTSLYAVLAYLARTHTNIITLEDPIERDLPKLTQVQVQPHLGLTFANGLRAALRHDPDVLMIGELMDRETTTLAVRAALSGRLVIAALHTPNAASAITRLLDFDIEPFLICSALMGVLSQRLVRRLCPACRQSVSVEPAQLASLGLVVPEAQAAVQVWQARGCGQCGQSGYQGCIGLFELLTVDHQLRSLILKRTPTAQLAQSAAARGMRRLWHAGWEHVRCGATSPQELLRVLPSEPR